MSPDAAAADVSRKVDMFETCAANKGNDCFQSCVRGCQRGDRCYCWRFAFAFLTAFLAILLAGMCFSCYVSPETTTALKGPLYELVLLIVVNQDGGA